MNSSRIWAGGVSAYRFRGRSNPSCSALRSPPPPPPIHTHRNKGGFSEMLIARTSYSAALPYILMSLNTCQMHVSSHSSFNRLPPTVEAAIVVLSGFRALSCIVVL